MSGEERAGRALVLPRIKRLRFWQVAVPVAVLAPLVLAMAYALVVTVGAEPVSFDGENISDFVDGVVGEAAIRNLGVVGQVTVFSALVILDFMPADDLRTRSALRAATNDEQGAVVEAIEQPDYRLREFRKAFLIVLAVSVVVGIVRLDDWRAAIVLWIAMQVIIQNRFAKWSQSELRAIGNLLRTQP